MSELQVDLGGRIAHAWVEESSTDDVRRSTIDLVGPGLTLFVGPDHKPKPDGPTRPGQVPVTTTALPPTAARALGLGPAGAVLVRPDGVPIASWWVADEADVDRAMDTYFHQPRVTASSPRSAA